MSKLKFCFLFLCIIKFVSATTMHNNEVVFEKPSDLLLSMTYIDSKVTDNQPWESGLVINESNPYYYRVTFKAGRKKSEAVAKYFIDNTGGKVANHFVVNDKPKELNFAVKTELNINNSKVNGDFYIAQGSYAAGSNDWWIGCSSDCLRSDTNELVVTTGKPESGNYVAYKIGAGLLSGNHTFKVSSSVSSDSNRLLFSYNPKSGIESVSVEEINPELIPLTLRDVNIIGETGNIALHIGYWKVFSYILARNFINLVKEIKDYPTFYNNTINAYTGVPEKVYFYLETRLYINGSPVVKYRTNNPLDKDQIAPVYIAMSYDGFERNWWIGTSGKYYYVRQTNGRSYLEVQTQDGEHYALKYTDSGFEIVR